jgi:hypothetical protein
MNNSLPADQICLLVPPVSPPPPLADLQDLHRMCSSRDGFGQRTLRPSPKGSAVKGMVPARLAQQVGGGGGEM